MTTLRERYLGIFGPGRTTERVVFFSDAVFAIALTLLVVDLRVPDVDSGESSGDVIVSLMPGFLAYVISFVVIAINWFGHHRKFRVIKAFDGRLLQINFVLLFLIAFTPFPTSLLSEYPAEVPSVVLYASVVGLLSLTQWVLWTYAYRHEFVDDSVDEALHRYMSRNILVTPAVFAVSIVIALLWSPEAAMYSWLALIPASIVVDRLRVRPRGG